MRDCAELLKAQEERVRIASGKPWKGLQPARLLKQCAQSLHWRQVPCLDCAEGCSQRRNRQRRSSPKLPRTQEEDVPSACCLKNCSSGVQSARLSTTSELLLQPYIVVKFKERESVVSKRVRTFLHVRKQPGTWC